MHSDKWVLTKKSGKIPHSVVEG